MYMQGVGRFRDAVGATVPARSFSFRTIAPSLTSDCLSRFLTVDRAAQSDQVALTKADLVDFIAYGLTLRKPEPDRLIAATAAFQLPGESRTRESLTSEVMRGNVLLCGQSNGSGAWRKAAVWVGRVPRERSVFEGADPKDIPRLMCMWSKLHERPMPLSLLLAISSLRLLQIHPFLDGNGRTARWTSLRLARSHSSTPNGFDALILRVWGKGAAFRHACSASVVEDEDWEPWLSAWSDHLATT